MNTSTPSAEQAMSVLHRETHGHLKLPRAQADFGFVRGAVTVALAGSELPAACSEYPCVVARQPDGTLSLQAVTGLQAGQNLFVGEDKRWLGQYLPATLATWPFRLVREGADEGRFLVAVQTQALSASQGDPLFGADGQESPWLLERLQQLTQTDAALHETSRLLAALDEAGVLAERSLQAVLPDGRDLELNGFMVVDEVRLQALPENTVHALHVQGALSLAYLQLLSLRRFRDLVTRSSRSADPASSVAAPVAESMPAAADASA